jgi:hypothetical protein
MFSMGFAVALGLLVTLAKMNWRWKMKLLSNPVAVDLAIFLILTMLHWGTFSGVMAATIGALICSIVLSAGRRLVGYIHNDSYVRGFFDVSAKL